MADRIKTVEEERALSTVTVRALQFDVNLASEYVPLLCITPFRSVFLKRMRKTEEFIQVLVGDDFNTETFPEAKVISVQVPEYAPVTLSQFREWNNVWPMSFHQQKLDADLRDGSIEAELVQRLKSGKTSFLARNGKIVSEIETHSPFGLNHVTLELIGLSSKIDDSQYLLTGFDLFVQHEPRLLCAMALVHSRISRVFFCSTVELCDFPLSKIRLQHLKSLNHRFIAYKVRE